jgi:hypothetical protein
MDPRAALANAEERGGPIELIDPAALPSPHLHSMLDVALANLPSCFSAAEVPPCCTAVLPIHITIKTIRVETVDLQKLQTLKNKVRRP